MAPQQVNSNELNILSHASSIITMCQCLKKKVIMTSDDELGEIFIQYHFGFCWGKFTLQYLIDDQNSMPKVIKTRNKTLLEANPYNLSLDTFHHNWEQ